ncbi:3-hydroxyacyl-ACP dehydratase FabZ family protein [Streptomyces melanosporofaciens]|uniref:3-hydroxyacyl-ACP dehydratase FabZ family protein n=1 Tax=unclassified Streptomyces TaxID=2593676 RepID=UPI0036C38052
MSRRFAAPLTAVDTVDIADTPGGARVEAVKRIAGEDPYLVGHYPDFTIYPGVFTLESVHQAIRHWATERHGPGAVAELAAITSISFAAPLLPGDTLRIGCDLTTRDDTPATARAKVRCHRGDGALSARMTLELRIDRRDGDDHA